MSAQILDGKVISKEVQDSIAGEVAQMKDRLGMAPGLHVVLVGENPASQVYVKNKHKTCEKLGFNSVVHKLAADAPESEVLDLVHKLNKDNTVHGILVQLPLPDHIDTQKVMYEILPEKDVDGFHPTNLGKLVIGETPYPPCTPQGIMELIKRSGMEIKGKEAVVIGRSNIVGKPVALLLLHEHATVTICHSRTKDLPGVSRRADIVVAAIGKPKFVTADFVKDGAVVIDVGINRLDDGTLVGDVDYDSVKEKASWITPVPGGVGPMTIAMLMKNTLRAGEILLEKQKVKA
jgi:methylenetetrahydrofolate dehydrogenase (NADP+) / methenyltetrahydrofolate cyclohydrolase